MSEGLVMAKQHKAIKKLQADLAREKAETKRLSDRVAQLDDSNRKAAVLLGYGDPPSVDEAVRLDEALAREKAEVNDLANLAHKAAAERDALADRVKTLERDMRDAGTPYSKERDAMNALVLRVAALEAALREIDALDFTESSRIARRVMEEGKK